MKVELILNGAKKVFDVAPDEYLLDTLRKHNIKSVRRGCDASSCGVCTVLIDDKPMLSCSQLTAQVTGKHVTTVEGIQDVADKLSDYFGQEGADQCGFCNTGMVLTVHAMQKELKNPSDQAIKAYVVGNLCRCSGYQAQFKAIKKYLGGESL